MLSFHPHVACSFTVFLSSVFVMVLVCIHVVAYVRFPVIGMVITVITIVIIMVVAMIIIVVITMFVTMVVVVVVCTTHCSNGNGECFHVFCFEFKHVFTCFEFVNRDCCASWTVA